MTKRFYLTILGLKIMFVFPFIMGLVTSILYDNLEMFGISFGIYLILTGFITSCYALVETIIFTIEQIGKRKGEQ